MQLTYYSNKVYEPVCFILLKNQIQAFSRAILSNIEGNFNGEEELAQPTFATSIRGREFEILEELGIQLSQCLHVDQSYEIEDPLRSGDKVVAKTEIETVIAKPDRPGREAMSFIRFLTIYEDELSGKLRLKSRSTILAKGIELIDGAK